LLRKIGVVLVGAVFILGVITTNCSARVFFSGGDEESAAGWRVLCDTDLPPGYEYYKWYKGYDFVGIRTLVGEVKSQMGVAYMVAGVCLGYVLGVALHYLATITIGGKIAITAEQAGLMGSAATAVAQDRSSSYHRDKKFSSISDQIKQLKGLGISDYYVFGEACRAPDAVMTTPTSLTLGDRSIWLPLGAWMKLEVMPKKPRPRVFRLKDPQFDFRKLGSRVWERSLSGWFQPTTVPFVFAYEVADGQIIPYAGGGGRPAEIKVIPYTPSGGGKVVGTFRLGRHPNPKLRMGGLREIHLCSPVNRGVRVKKLDDYAFAIILNRMTVSKLVTFPSEPKVDQELEVRVNIPGFHTGISTIHGSDGRQYRWEDIADAIFEGAFLDGAGIKATRIEHQRSNRCTVLRGTPTKPGEVKVVLPTIHGSAVLEASTVEKGETPVRLGALTKDDCPSSPEPNLYLSEAHVEYDAEVNCGYLDCKYGLLFNGEKQGPWIGSIYGWTHVTLFTFDSIEKAREIFTEGKPKFREQIEEEKRKQREKLGREPPMEDEWDESDPDALIVKSIDSSMADRKFYIKGGWFHYKNCIFTITTHKDRDQDWVRRVFDKLKKDLEALVDRKEYEGRPPA